MSDGDSIGSVLKDLARETVKQVSSAPLTIVKGIPNQVLGSSEEDEAKKKAEKMLTHQRIKEIEAEMAQIRHTNEQQKAQQTPEYKKTLQNLASNSPKKIDESSRQAVGKAEQGRNFKG